MLCLEERQNSGTIKWESQFCPVPMGSKIVPSPPKNTIQNIVDVSHIFQLIGKDYIMNKDDISRPACIPGRSMSGTALHKKLDARKSR